MVKDKIIVVSGPTASGKSDIAIALARRFNGEIISADSRQVYAGMDLGTGKVRRDKGIGNRGKGLKSDFYSEGIRHWMLDVVSPTSQYSVARFKRDAQKAILDIVRRGKLPIICGGTGFWIDALVYDMQLPDVKPDAKLRARLQKLSTTQLFARLKKLDPERAATIDKHNSVRLVRALEIIAATGKPVPTQPQSAKFKVQNDWDVLYLGISIPKEKLIRRIEKRLDARLRHGMLAEVKHLHTSGVSWKRLESFGLEYRWLARFLRSESKVKSKKAETFDLGLSTLTFQQMRKHLLADIIAYAKRQLTWWRKNKDIRWVNGSTSLTTSQNEANGLVRKFLPTT